MGEWRDGQNLPLPGSLILVDEASMATTGLLVEVAELAHANGAMLRLVGDPRQLKAVGAGGGLQIVAEAAGSPELVELRRFNHPWEAAATLDLRAGRAGVIDTYEQHRRIAPGGSAEVLDDIYRAWQTSPAGPAGTIMIASDNGTVQALNERARTDLVPAGLVAAEGVDLADGSTAGVGDIIVTRRNDRTLPTSQNSGPDGFVRNRDRWVVQSCHPDGSLLVSHVRVGAQVTLPADYVAEHAELSYALTGHGAQGITVEAAHAVIQPGDTRDYLYVAASRGRDSNQLHVVTDVWEDEPAGYHPERSARDVLAAVLTRDEPPAATEHLVAARARSRDIGELAAQYRYGASVELDRRLTTALEAHEADSLLAGEDAWEVRAAAARAEGRGVDIGQVIAGAEPTDLGSVENLTGRIDRARIQAGANRQPWPELVADVLPVAGPQVAPDMAAWLDTVADRLEQRRDELAANYSHTDPGEWALHLGAAPAEPTQRAQWARQVAKVQMWRETNQILNPDTLLGPVPPSRDPAYRGWQRAEAAAETAARISAGDQAEVDVEETASPTINPADPTLSPPTPEVDGPRPGGPTL
jgi:AAA domain